jgi:hypothetical protein
MALAPRYRLLSDIYIYIYIKRFWPAPYGCIAVIKSPHRFMENPMAAETIPSPGANDFSDLITDRRRRRIGVAGSASPDLRGGIAAACRMARVGGNVKWGMYNSETIEPRVT